jgi:hypothetical protein
VKLDVDALSTVPDEPPAAGPERALDPPPLPGSPCPATAEGDVPVAGEEAVVAEEDAAQPVLTPITAHIAAVASTRPRLLVHLFDRCAAGDSSGRVGWYSFMMALL